MQKHLEKIFRRTGREYQQRQRFLALLLLAPIFVVILPYALIRLGASIDRSLGCQAIILPPASLLIGIPVVFAGWILAMWAIYTQFTIGRGTPVPVMPTQKLIIQPPFSYCRNPMALGTIIAVLGVAVSVGSIGAVLVALLGAGLLLTYIKLIEEKEMEIRFGQEYQEYRRQTPFLIPRLKKG